MADRSEDEMRRLAELLAEAVHFSRRTRQSLEQELGFASGHLSKVFHGRTPLNLRSLLLVLEALGLSPRDFFGLAFKHAPASTPEGRKIFRELAERHDGQEEESEDFDQKVRGALGRILGVPQKGDL